MQGTPLGRLRTLLASGAPSGNDTVLSTGDNTLTIPSGSDLVVIVPPADNTSTITVKGTGADTGVVVSSNFPIVLTRASGNIVVNVSADTRVQLLWSKQSAL